MSRYKNGKSSRSRVNRLEDLERDEMEGDAAMWMKKV